MHEGQLDKADAPYALHALRVMLDVPEAARIAGVPHDVVEDTYCTLDDLRQLGFGEEVVATVDALTRRPHENSDDAYFAYVKRAASHDVARHVKLADLRDNMDVSRILAMTDADRQRLIRYRQAMALVRSIGRARGDAFDFPEIVPLESEIQAAWVEEELKPPGRIYICDFYVNGAERGTEVLWGTELGRMVHIDHHAPGHRMERHVTSTMLAKEFVQAGSAIEPGSYVVINHTDCDSMLSSALMMGLLPPSPDFVAASVAADHTGAQDAIADLLQALDEERQGPRTREQYAESIRNLRLSLDGRPVEHQARRAMELRDAKRSQAEAAVMSGKVKDHGGIAFGVVEGEIEGAFFPSLLPHSKLIVVACPRPGVLGEWIVKVRLGSAAPPGMTLHSLAIKKFDPEFGGRWNAGSNKRGKKTILHPDAWLEAMHQRVARYDKTAE